MYNLNTIKEKLRGLVGFRLSSDVDVNVVDSTLQASRSGLYLDYAHALITPQILEGAVLVPTITPASPSNPPESDNDPLSALISRVLDDAASTVVISLHTRKLLRYEAKTLLPVTPLYEGEGSISDHIQPNGRFVALRILPVEYDVAVGLTRIGLQFTGEINALPIIGFAADGITQLGTVIVKYTRPGRMQWFDVNLPLSGSESYIVGYREADLPVGVQAVRRAKTVGYVPCSACNPQNAALAARWKPFINVEAVRIDNPGDEIDVVSEQNYGINLAFSIGCDLTDIVIKNELALAPAIQQQAVVLLLNHLAFNPLITTLEQQTKQNAMFALQNGEQSKLDTLLDALDIDLSGLSAKCLPDVQNASRIKRTTVWGR